MSEWKGIWRQSLAGGSGNLILMASGCAFGWTSPIFPKLEQPNAFLHPTLEERTWIGSLLPLGAIFGAVPGGLLADKIGRKWTMLLLAIPFLISWILITTAENLAMIYIGRFIVGIAVGGAYTVPPMYTGEIAGDNVRGGLGSMFFFCHTAGLLYEYAIGPYVSYTWLGYISMIVPIAFAVAFCFMPESPYYLLMKGKKEEASKTLQWLRNLPEDGVEEELRDIQKHVDEDIGSTSTMKELFTTRGNIRALVLTWCLVGLEICSGIDVIYFYSTTIFMASGGSLSGDLSSIVVAVVMLIFSVVSPLLVDKTGRKPMLYLSSVGMIAAHLTLGFYFYYKDVENEDMEFLGWLPVSSMILFITTYSVGFGPLPWAIMGELFPTNIKGIASASTVSFSAFLAFLNTLFFEHIVESLGMHSAFWIFAGFSFFAIIFVFFFLFETKGKSLNEIQQILNKKK